MSDQKLQADLDAANLRIKELKLDFKAMRSEAIRLEGEVLKAAGEVEELSDATHHPTQGRPERRKEDEFLRKARKAWSEWVLHLFELTTLSPDGSRTLSAELVRRWGRLATTPFDPENPTDYQASNAPR